MYAGAVEEGERFVQPLRELAEPMFDLSGQMPYTVVQSLLDSFYPAHQYLHYWKSLHLNNLDEEAIATLIDWADNRPSTHGSIDLWAMGGAVSRVGADATALGERSAPFTLVWNTTWSDQSESEKNIAWTRACYQAMQPYSPGRSYLNFPGFGEEGDELVRMAYGHNYDRLVAIKNTYDPTNLFRLNQNIKPTV
jgi:FAD/FMN-containing dehydrogenase